jgi:hypothetical protein
MSKLIIYNLVDDIHTILWRGNSKYLFANCKIISSLSMNDWVFCNFERMGNALEANPLHKLSNN